MAREVTLTYTVDITQVIPTDDACAVERMASDTDYKKLICDKVLSALCADDAMVRNLRIFINEGG